MCETGYICKHFNTDKFLKNPTEYLVTCVRSHNELGLETPFSYSALH